MQNEMLLSKKLLEGTGISIIDASRLIRNILDSKEAMPYFISDALYCQKVINLGIKSYKDYTRSKNLFAAFNIYLKTKSSLNKDTLKDIKYIASRLFRICPEMKNATFTNLTSMKCQKWIESCFSTPSQFNKARTFLSGFFSFAQKNKWLKENFISEIKAKKIKEKKIIPLKIEEIANLLEIVKTNKFKESAPALGIMLWAGIRPKEVSRLKWEDIDMEENIITITSNTSKTGGVRHVEILAVLKKWLLKYQNGKTGKICPPDWIRKWKSIRDSAGFKGIWTNDVLRHTFASYHLKYFKNLIRLQSEMGHRDLNLLRSRYVNMNGITKKDAETFMNLHKTNFNLPK